MENHDEPATGADEGYCSPKSTKDFFSCYGHAFIQQGSKT